MKHKTTITKEELEDYIQSMLEINGLKVKITKIDRDSSKPFTIDIHWEIDDEK